jgi:imidazolonepropionase
VNELVLHNAHVLSCDPARRGLGIIDCGAIAIDRGRIAWVGDEVVRPHGKREVDLGGRLVSPGLVDCHTHAYFGGDRAHEFELRAAGKTYLEIQQAGGGIASTLAATRGHAREAFPALSARLTAALAGGTTTIEVKSGYDLTFEGERTLLDLLKEICDLAPEGQALVPTLLAHLVPPERARDRAAFVREICEQWIPAVTHLARSFDVWCEQAAFTLAEARQMLEAARAHGLPIRGHVGQLSDLGGPELLAELGALSADHLEFVSDGGIAALARAGTVAVMLPGACVQLRLPVPPVDKLRAAGVMMAVATDLNPGSRYCETLPIQMWLATTHFGMTVDEAWLGVTRHAARALGVEAGALRVDARADLVIWNCERPAEVPYRYGRNLVDQVYVAGKPVQA